jgi:hypothetical protein
MLAKDLRIDLEWLARIALLPTFAMLVLMKFHCNCQIAAIVGLLFFAAVTSADSIVIDFESLPYGSRYGSTEGDVPGDLAFSQDGIDVRLRQFVLGSWSGFSRAEVGGFTDSAFPTTPITISNINLEFDFSQLPFDIDEVSFEYVDMGGSENLGVGSQLLQVSSLDRLPASIGGASVLVTQNGIPGGQRGIVTLRGAIELLTIGGQEFGIDNLTITGTAPVPGDYDGDGRVTQGDYFWWRRDYGSTNYFNADGNRDGRIDAADYTIWRDGIDAASIGIATPEPKTATVLFCLLAIGYSSSCRKLASTL